MMDFVHYMDKIIYNTIYSTNSEIMNVVMITITNFSSALILILISIASYFILNNKKIAQHIMLNLAMAFVLNNILKEIFARERPKHVMHLVQENGYSFPSGHTMVGAAFYGLIIYLIYKNVKDKKIKIISVTFLSILILLIGISRIYLGAHYATDVIGGLIFAAIYLFIYIKFIFNEREEKK